MAKKYHLFLEAKLNELYGLSQETYEIPENFWERLYDFYAMSLIQLDKLKDDDVKIYFEEAKNLLIQYMFNEMEKVLYRAITAEVWHFLDTSDYLQLSEEDIRSKFNYSDITIINKMLDEKSVPRSYAVREKFFRDNKITSEGLVRFARKIFDKLEWDRSYGGKAWIRICDALYRLISNEKSSISNKMVLVDNIIDIEHNSGSVFDKTDANETYNNMLTERAIQFKVTAEPQEFVDKVSQQLKNPIQIAFKDMGYIKIDSDKKDRLNDIEYIETNYERVESDAYDNINIRYYVENDNGLVRCYIKDNDYIVLHKFFTIFNDYHFYNVGVNNIKKQIKELYFCKNMSESKFCFIQDYMSNIQNYIKDSREKLEKNEKVHFMSSSMSSAILEFFMDNKLGYWKD